MGELLIVDDDRHLAKSLAQYLGYVGFSVCVAFNGQEALTMLSQCGELPCAILVDLMMPVMDGVALITALAGNPKWAKIPVIITTCAPESATKGLEHAKYIFRKPVNMKTLIAVLRHYCRRTA
jgi:DNA-binding response OmpR family regulator